MRFEVRRLLGRFLLTAMSVAGVLACDPSADAQLFRGRFLRPAAEPGIEAIAGDPYGVGRWTVQLPPGVNPALLGNNNFILSEKNGRVQFQAFQTESLRAVREFLGRPQTATVYFLFTGDAPLQLELYTPTGTATTVTPQREPVGHARLLTEWWVSYARQANRIDRSADYPDLVDNYLLATLSRRLNLPPAGQMPPPLVQSLANSLFSSITGIRANSSEVESGDEELDRQLGMLLGADNMRSQMQTQVLARRSEPLEAADQPLPAGIPFAAKLPEPLGGASIEPIALHVPAECYYVRFGTFPNYLWWRHTMTRWHDDLQNLLNRRGLDYGLTVRVERQISLKEPALAELLGPTIISDVAMVGGDLFFREGAAVGVLFQARNNFALSSDFTRQRAETLKREPGCTQKQVEIAGHQVSFLSTPDNRVRSFYAVDGDFHFVTNSQRLVERFFAVGAGKEALGQTAEFRYARSLMPISNDYTVFAYLSGEFFRNLVGPHYQVEMARRMRSAAEIDMAMVAQLAARGNRHEAQSLDELIAAQYLPEGFGERVDGSRLVQNSAGQFDDSLRGARGTFLPVPDVAFDRITPEESRRYQQFATWLQSKWSQFDPVVAGVKRKRGAAPDVDHIVLDVQLTPLAAKNYDTIATALGPLTKQKLAPIPGDLISAEVILSGNLLSSKGMGQPQGVYRAFGAIRDAVPEALNPAGAGQDSAQGGAPQSAPAAGQPGASGITINGVPLGRGGLGNGQLLGGLLGNAGGAAAALLSPTGLLPPFYFGAYPTPAAFTWLGVGQVQLDAAGYGRSPGGMWQRRDGNFTAASPQRDILEIVTPQFKFIDAPRPAQAWLHSGDLGRSKLTGLVNGLFYRAAKMAAIGNLRFLQELNTQLRVPPQDCLNVAQQLTDAQFVCPLGGQYQLQQQSGGPSVWASTALPAAQMRLLDGLFSPAPADFTAPILNWLRQLDADLSLDQRTIALHAEVDMQQGETAAPSAPKPAAAPSKQSAAPPAASPKAESLPPPPPPRLQQQRTP